MDMAPNLSAAVLRPYFAMSRDQTYIDGLFSALVSAGLPKE